MRRGMMEPGRMGRNRPRWGMERTSGMSGGWPPGEGRIRRVGPSRGLLPGSSRAISHRRPSIPPPSTGLGDHGGVFLALPVVGDPLVAGLELDGQAAGAEDVAQ